MMTKREALKVLKTQGIVIETWMQITSKQRLLVRIEAKEARKLIDAYVSSEDELVRLRLNQSRGNGKHYLLG